MKRILSRSGFAFCFSILILTACQKEEPYLGKVDVRDMYVGDYICDVTKKNFQTDVILNSYQDTLKIVKQGDDKLIISKTQYIQLPEVKYQENGSHPMYVTLATVVVFDKDNLNITHGHDTAFYEFKGIRKR